MNFDRFRAEDPFLKLLDANTHRVQLVRAARATDWHKEGPRIDQRYAPWQVAQIPGRRLAANHYRNEDTPHQRYFQMHSDQIMGTLIAVKGNSLEIETESWKGLDLETKRITVAVADTCRAFVDGNLNQGTSGLKAGQFIRIFPARKKQTVVFLDEHRYEMTPSQKGQGSPPDFLLHPAAYFRASGLVFNADATVEFDASYFYHPEGSEIRKYE